MGRVAKNLTDPVAVAEARATSKMKLGDMTIFDCIFRGCEFDPKVRLEALQPNGKSFSDCTKEDLRGLAKWHGGEVTVRQMIETGHMTMRWAMEEIVKPILRNDD